jgi:hypothetical protein
MAHPGLGVVVAAAWEEALETSPDPWRGDGLFDLLTGRHRLYRDRLDAREVNFRGAVIPRIERVRRHLRALGPIRLDPRRLR